MRSVAEGGWVVQRSHMENHKGETNPIDKVECLWMELGLMAEEAGEGPVKRAERSVEGGQDKTVGGVGLAVVVGLDLRYD